MASEAGRDLERELREDYPELALLLRRAATLQAWQPSRTGEAALRRLAGAVAHVLEQRLSSAEADAYMAEVTADLQSWLRQAQQAHSRRSTHSPMP